ncbi:site-specific DNA-methyltransferase [Parenemella sanctibonifatiensis]|uniref:Site-specific DNA-methyltransferase n=1 Tax=Parenemella sanctibonifatiensis TaxID=2016505 RepID=A0A255ED55_9ACTN|nr:site-specific DNA-methyltransferase [Parenemella sanctibonifatiensis]OYN89477.1 site-specific DNA-methyltransferase [Parenemella sanctibonifatiensis]
MKRSPKGRLELTWMGKDSALIPVEDGKYDYSFVDPDDPRALEVKSIEVLEQVGEVDGPTGANENLLIIGDSGDALRSLVTIPEYHDKYAGQVKLVYIDPPFNTEKTFEHYVDQLEHSIWLTMMRDRIRDIKPLLSGDASVWVHLDHSEVHRMRVLLDEEFGPECFVSSVIWRSADTGNYDDARFSNDHNTILVYSLNAGWAANGLERNVKQSSHYRNPDNDPRGPWFDGNPLGSPNPRENLMYDIVSPQGNTIRHPPHGWRWQQSTMDRMIEDGAIRFNDEGTRIIYRTYLREQGDLPPSDLWDEVSETGSNRKAKNELKALFGLPAKQVFSTPKPESLLRRIITIATNQGDLVLDFFGGSGSTAAVAHKMGRRWVTVELQRSTVDQFLLPRLRRVVDGSDTGGISQTTQRIAASGTLAGTLTPEEAAEFVRQLKKVVSDLEGLDEATISRMSQSLRTRNSTTTHWRGGGGFTVAKMGPSMYEVDDEDGSVYLSPEATNGAWSKAIAGQLKFTLTPDDPVFCGVRKRQRLAVIDGVADETVVRTVVEHLGEKEKAVIVAKGVLPEAGDLLQRLSPGSRIKKAPEDMFPKGTVN